MNHIQTNLADAPFRLRGDVEMLIHGADGELLRRIEIRNTITYDGMGALLYLLSQDGVTVGDYQITELRAGSSAVPPSRSDTALGDQKVVKALSAANRLRSLPTGELVIQTQLATHEGVGQTLREAGLFLGNGQLFARQVHAAIEKTDAISITYSWRISVTA